MALTITNRRVIVVGSMREVLATLVSTTGTDVWTTGLKVIKNVSLDQVAGTPGNVGASAVSATGSGTVTLAVPANSTISASVTGW